MSKIKRITVSNLKAVSSLTVDFEGCTAIITGGNNMGKSSFLKSLPDRLRGIKPDMILKQGEKDGAAELELTTGEKIIWTFDDKGKEKLLFISERNIKSSVTKEISNYYFPAVFDVDKFLQDPPAKQKATLQKISGIDFSEIDREIKAAFENRTWANKQVVNEKAKLLDFDPKLNMVPVDVTAWQTEMNGIEAHNEKCKYLKQGCYTKELQRSENLGAIKKLEEQIEFLQKSNEKMEAEISAGNDWLSKYPAKTNASELKVKIEAANISNKAITENEKALAQQKTYEAAIVEAERLDNEVKDLEAMKAEALRSSKLPAGFGFNEDSITYNDLPFNRESLSSSSLYIAALKLAAKGLGEVKTLHFDASFLDKNSLQEIEQWANTQGLQLLIERPDFDGGEIEYQLLMQPEMAAA